MLAADDPRHGTYAGAMQHQKDGNMCPPCSRARAAYIRTRRERERSNKCHRGTGQVPGIRSGLGWPLRGEAK
jgi:hypothetical protein